MIKAIIYERIGVLMMICIFIIGSPECISAQLKDLPRPAALALKKAYDSLEKNEIFSAINILESFIAKSEKETELEKTSIKGSQHHLILFTLGNCYLMSDNPKKAQFYYHEALKDKADFSPAWLNLAKCHFELADYGQAGHCFIKGYETSAEKAPEILYHGAISFMAGEDYKTALEVFERLLAAHKDLVKLEWKENIVQAYLAVDRPRKALPIIEELSEKSSGNKKKQWQEVLLSQYLNLDMKQRGLEYAERLIREYPLEPKWWKALAHLHLTENRHEEGLIALTVYSHLTPLTVEEKKLMAELNLSIGVPAQAALFYEDILSEKMDLSILKKLAESYLYLHRHDDALKWVEKGLQEEVDEELLILKGNVLYEIKKYDEAMKVFESIPHGENSGQAMLMLGYAAWNAGNLDKATHAFQKASKYPEHQKTALKVLQQLKKIGNQKRS